MAADPLSILHLSALKNEPDPDDTITVANYSSPADETSDLEDEFDDRDNVLRPCVQSLGLSTSYVPHWKPLHGFREFYQNWKDGIIASFGIDRSSFCPETKVTANQIQIKISRDRTASTTAASKQLLGFIRFNRKAGSLELTNFKARLEIDHLSLGSTTKRDRDELAGMHGEGFKLAALVMRRNGYAVRFATSGYYWNFGLRGTYHSNLYCRLSQAKPEMVEKKRAEYIARSTKLNFRRDLTSNIWEDVTVKFGKGRGATGKQISEEDFKSWLKVALDLEPPSSTETIRTAHGDLILEKSFAHHIYLKGLLITDNDSRHRFGYNFIHGHINRDRDRLANQSEETDMLARIWEEVILSNGHSTIDTYIDLFRTHEACVEVAASDKISGLAVQAIWNRLRSSSPDTFFHPENDPSSATNHQVTLITIELKKTPVVLPTALWRLLRKHSLARTIQEERFRLFKNSEVVPTPRNTFCVNIMRALQASFMLSPKLKDLKLEIVRGGGTELDLLLHGEEHLLQLHEKWLCFRRAHEGAACEFLRLTQTRSSDSLAFFCDHAVEDLFETILTTIGTSVGITSPEARMLRRITRERLRLMPRLVQALQIGLNECEVSWVGNESGLVSEKYSADIQYHVVLHKVSSCKAKLGALLYLAGETHRSCHCPHQMVTRTRTKVVFSGLDQDESYFPTVARAENLAFFGKPPAAISLKATIANHNRLSEQPVRLASSRRPPTTTGENVSGTRERSQDFRAESHIRASKNSEMMALTLAKSPSPAESIVSQQLHTPPGSSNGGTHEEGGICRPFLEQDEKHWQTWYHQKMQHAFAQLMPHSGKGEFQKSCTPPSLECSRLNFTFGKDEYARIRLLSGGAAGYVILVHDFQYNEDEPDEETTILLVTKFSFLAATYPFCLDAALADLNTPASDKELLLHFEAFENMGQRADAVIIKLKDIVHAECLTVKEGTNMDSVDLVVQYPKDLQICSMFCRFGIRTAGPGKVACLTPIASHLLPSSDRWRGLKFSDAVSPAVLDFTPGVLGPSEGFSQAGYDIQAAIGFDQEQHLTWKIRHNSSHTYDGSPEHALHGFASGLLQPPPTLQPETPKVALVAGTHACFRLQEKNIALPSLEHFLKPLSILEAAVESTLRPEFSVLLISPAVLHERAAGRLGRTLLNLLEKRLSVHVRLIALQDCGLPQERSALLLATSPFCAPLPWTNDWPTAVPQSSVAINDILDDLSFANPLVENGTSRGLVCSLPIRDASSAREVMDRPQNVYNHRTGRPALLAKAYLDLVVTGSFAPNNTFKDRMHPNRKDLLTIREIARLQGFPDDFVSYQSEGSQYTDVLRAQPPVLTRLVAKAIRGAIYSSLKVKVGERRASQHPSKRPRLDDDSV